MGRQEESEKEKRGRKRTKRQQCLRCLPVCLISIKKKETKERRKNGMDLSPRHAGKVSIVYTSPIQRFIQDIALAIATWSDLVWSALALDTTGREEIKHPLSPPLQAGSLHATRTSVVYSKSTKIHRQTRVDLLARSFFLTYIPIYLPV